MVSVFAKIASMFNFKLFTGIKPTVPGERRTMAENIAISSSVRFNLLKRSAKSNMESSKKPALLVV